MTKDELEAELAELNKELIERKGALPAHSIRPHQILRIEEIEDRIAELQKELEGA